MAIECDHIYGAQDAVMGTSCLKCGERSRIDALEETLPTKAPEMPQAKREVILACPDGHPVTSCVYVDALDLVAPSSRCSKGYCPWRLVQRKTLDPWRWSQEG